MGDVAEMMIDGTLCCQCGRYIGKSENGYPTKCNDCKPKKNKKNKKVKK